MLKLENHSDHKTWETPEANGNGSYGNGYELRSEYVTKHVESNRNSLRVMVTELYHTQKEFMSQPLQYTQKMHKYWSTVARTRSFTTWMCHSSPISSIR